MTNAELDKEIIKLWFPAVLNLMMIPLVGAVDVFWVGRLNDKLALAGMGAANQVRGVLQTLVVRSASSRPQRRPPSPSSLPTSMPP